MGIHLDLFGISQKSSFILRGTSVHRLKVSIWQRFWEEDVDIGDPQHFYLQYFDTTEFHEFIDLDRIDALPRTFDDIQLRLAPLCAEGADPSTDLGSKIRSPLPEHDGGDQEVGKPEVSPLLEAEPESSRKPASINEFEIGRRIQRIKPLPR